MRWSKMSRLHVFIMSLVVILASPMLAVAETVKTDLTGYEETPLTLSTPARGEFKARIKDNETIEYELSYRDTESAVTQAHIHFGAPAISGGIVVFLCTNLGNAPATVPVPQTCPAAPATIMGTLRAADVGASAGSIAQGIDVGQFAEFVRAIRAGATYVNVHTTVRTGGEIRGQIDRGHHDH
jgi:CHRD domain